MDDYVNRAEYAERMKRIEDEDARQNKRLEKLEELMENINSLTISVEKMASALQLMQKEQERQGERLDAIEREPADKWRTIIKTVLTVTVTAIVTYMISHGGI